MESGDRKLFWDFQRKEKLKAIDEVVEKQKDNKYERSEISKEMTKVIDPIYSQIKELTEQSKKLFDQHDKPFHEVLESDLKEFLKAKEFTKKANRDKEDLNLRLNHTVEEEVDTLPFQWL